MNKPHKHAALIKAWADGARIQNYSNQGGHWIDLRHAPQWHPDVEYRIKPEREYPKTNLNKEHLFRIGVVHPTWFDGCTAVANAAIKQYIIDSEGK